jgi:putative transposase
MKKRDCRSVAPFLTLAVDICTRMVAGSHLSLYAPSSASVGFCLMHAVYDKTSWLQERRIEHPWPVAGLPSVLHCENGAEFHSRALKTACREYGIKLVYRPPATPRFGGHIERLIGTMMGAVRRAFFPTTIASSKRRSSIKLYPSPANDGRANKDAACARASASPGPLATSWVG